MNLTLNYKEYGQGDPVIILHGMFGTLDNWQTIAKQLSENFTVYILDQRNHGRSPHHEEFNYDLLAEDLRHFMETHWIYKAHLIGHSMGGKTVMQFALNNEDMVDKLCVLDMLPKKYAGGHEVILDTLTGIDLEKVQDRKEVEAIMAASIPEVGVRQFLLKNLTHDTETGKFEWKINLPVLHRAYQSILDDVSGEIFEGKTLFVRGENSDYVENMDFETAKKRFPNVRLETIPNAGHWIHAEQPKALLTVLKNFFNE